MALVSVIIPTTRRPGQLRRALDSVFSQTYRDLEAIVVVDGPNPETMAMLAHYAEPRLRVLQNDRALGPGPTRNLGAEAAHGEWLAFLDDDDEWLANKLERQLAAASIEEAVLLTCRCRVITPHASYAWPRCLYDARTPVDEYLWQRRSLFRGEAYLATASYLLPRWLFMQARFGSTRQREDDTLLLRLTKECGARIVMLPDVLVVIHADDPRNSLGNNFVWRDMLAWIESMGSLVTPRAYSGFCLVVLASRARRTGDFAGLALLLQRSFTRGAPTPNQLLLFAAFWILPMQLRQRLRALVQYFSSILQPALHKGRRKKRLLSTNSSPKSLSLRPVNPAPAAEAHADPK